MRSLACRPVFFFQAEDGIRDLTVTGVQTCALPISANVKVGGTVTWTWNSGNTGHNVTYASGPTTLPANSPSQAGATTFSTMGTTARTETDQFSMDVGTEGKNTVLHYATRQRAEYEPR